MKTRIIKRIESGKKLNGLLVLGMAVSLAVSPVPVWAGNDNYSTNPEGYGMRTKPVPPQQPVQPQKTSAQRGQVPVNVSTAFRSVQTSSNFLVEPAVKISNPLTVKIDRPTDGSLKVTVDVNKAKPNDMPGDASMAASWAVRAVMGASLIGTPPALLEGQAIGCTHTTNPLGAGTPPTTGTATCHISADSEGNEQDIELTYRKVTGKNKPYEFTFPPESTPYPSAPTPPYFTQILRDKQGTKSKVTAYVKYSRSKPIPNDGYISYDLIRLALAARYNIENPRDINVLSYGSQQVKYTVARYNEPNGTPIQFRISGVKFVRPIAESGATTAVYMLSIIS